MRSEQAMWYDILDLSSDVGDIISRKKHFEYLTSVRMMTTYNKNYVEGRT